MTSAYACGGCQAAGLIRYLLLRGIRRSHKLNRVPLRMDFTEINSRGKRGVLLGRIDRQNSRFRTAKTTIIKFGFHASFFELESAKNALNEKLFSIIFLQHRFIVLERPQYLNGHGHEIVASESGVRVLVSLKVQRVEELIHVKSLRA
ncbi:uncharacterized protein TNCV_764721 [Trichonephila clavipes]|nr:uncharacterized protein TNCV_764721 [Trichonephila clavipes]